MDQNDFESLPTSVISEIERHVNRIISSASLFYRLFARQKSSSSASKKIKIKKYDHTKKMQDLFGVRIALYFKDDIRICRELIEKNFNVVGISEDIEKTSVFEPVRLNYVCRLPTDIRGMITNDFWNQYPIDDTFEIQIRTVFSEGWHEIEHDLRYKCKEDWKDDVEMSRALNGIFATLETCDWSIISLFDKLSYQKYISNSWEAMLRNKLRIRISDNAINPDLRKILDNKKEIAKGLYKLDREEFILLMSNKPFSAFPKTYDNIIYIANMYYWHDSEITSLTPDPLIKKKHDYLSDM